jgi:chemotaxis signal transduction protein
MTAELLMFRVGRELFATDLRAVEEAIDLTTVEQVTATSAPVQGIFTLRGALVPLFSPAHALGVSPTEGTTALIVRDGAGRIAIVTDDVEDVLTIEANDIRPVPTDAYDAGVLRGVVRHGPELVALVDLDALISACRGGPQQGAA